MTGFTCHYPGDREQAIVSYLYGDEADIDNVGRTTFEAHLATCDQCRAEIAAFGQVRASLATWSPPELDRVPAFAGRSEDADLRSHASQPWWRAVPAWAQAAAALLCLAAAAGIANLDIRYDAAGFQLRTGWMTPSQAANSPAAQPGAAAPWISDLAAVESRLRSDIQQSAASAQPVATEAAVASPEALRRVRALIDESERRQQRELALRLAEAIREINAQRQADLARIDRNIGLVQNTTGREMMRQRSEMLNYLTVRTSSQRPQ